MRPDPEQIAFSEELVATHERGVKRFLRFLGCDELAADEIAHEAFLMLWRRPPEDRGTAALAAWLRQVARNLMRQQRRATRAGIELAEADELEAAWLRNAGDGDGSDYVDALRACLDELPDRQRRAVQRRYADDASRDEIAAELGVSVEGIKTALRRAKEALGACVRRKLGRTR